MGKTPCLVGLELPPSTSSFACGGAGESSGLSSRSATPLCDSLLGAASTKQSLEAVDNFEDLGAEG